MFNVELPGSSIEVIDELNQTLYDTSQFGTTESILIIGTAFDGPVGKEIAIYEPDQAAYIFGGTYDHKTRRSASLVAYIEDAFSAGNRTIYAMRAGGKEISKNYYLREGVPLYLKVSGLFPSNKYKNMSMLYMNNKVVIYKTAEKATIEEKRQGVIESSDSMIAFTMDLANTYNITKDSRLVDMIELINKYTKNNVYKLSLVDENGVEVTQSELAQTISVGALMEGLYTIGRVNKESALPNTVTKVSVPATKPYKGFNGHVLIDIESNTDFEAPYPYKPQSATEAIFDTLKQPGGLDGLCNPDQIDYEEVNMTPFELYQKLGSGYAQTARIEEKNGKHFVKPTPSDSPSYTVEIADGIYSIAANLKADNRIMVAEYADTRIMGKLPSKEAFMQANIQAIPVLFTDGDTQAPALTASYKLEDQVIENFKFVSKSVEALSGIAKSEIVGASFETGIKTLDKLDTIAEGKLAIVSFGKTLWVAKKAVDTVLVVPIEDIENEKEFAITLKRVTAKPEGAGTVHYEIGLEILSAAFEDTQIFQWAEAFNVSALSQIFKFTYSPEKANALAVPNTGIVTPNKVLAVNENLFIPYTTNDNFARQLAQHVTYTSLKSYQTHGGIGISPIIDFSIRAVAEKCARILELELNLYVKNGAGRSVLDKDNMPYHIGKDISIPTWQHYITTRDGYNLLASGVASYFGLASTLADDVSTTNQPVKITPTYLFSETQKVALNKKGYLTLDSKNNGYYVTDGVTLALNNSQFSRYATNRTIKLVNGAIREATEPFIGKKNDLANRNSMYTAIKSKLDKLLGHYLERYEFKLVYNKNASRLGEINIDYDIDITNEIRNVKNRVTAKSNM